MGSKNYNYFTYNPVSSSRVFKRFQDLAPDIIPLDLTSDETSNLKIPAAEIANMPELKVGLYSRQNLNDVIRLDARTQGRSLFKAGACGLDGACSLLWLDTWGQLLALVRCLGSYSLLWLNTWSLIPCFG